MLLGRLQHLPAFCLHHIPDWVTWSNSSSFPCPVESDHGETPASFSQQQQQQRNAERGTAASPLQGWSGAQCARRSQEKGKKKEKKKKKNTAALGPADKRSDRRLERQQEHCDSAEPRRKQNQGRGRRSGSSAFYAHVICTGGFTFTRGGNLGGTPRGSEAEITGLQREVSIKRATESRNDGARWWEDWEEEEEGGGEPPRARHSRPAFQQDSWWLIQQQRKDLQKYTLEATFAITRSRLK